MTYKRSRAWKVLFSTLFALSAIVLISGCAHLKPSEVIDFGSFNDGPVPPDVSRWLENSEQTRLNPETTAAIRKIIGQNRRERLYRSVEFIWENFDYYPDNNHIMFLSASEKLYHDKKLGGCMDYALIASSMFRTLGIPTRMVMTASVKWINELSNNPLSMPEGHTFLEVYLEDRWYLVDIPFRFIYSEYSLDSYNYPRQEIFCRKGTDFWEMGIRNIEQLRGIMLGCASGYKPGTYKLPPFDWDKI